MMQISKEKNMHYYALEHLHQIEKKNTYFALIFYNINYNSMYF